MPLAEVPVNVYVLPPIDCIHNKKNTRAQAASFRISQSWSPCYLLFKKCFTCLIHLQALILTPIYWVFQNKLNLLVHYITFNGMMYGMVITS